MSRKVTIIGAGAAGLTCARQLIENGFKVSIFDKSRGTGGRIATRRIENGLFNHGASRIPDFRYCNSLPENLKKLLETAVELRVLIPQDNYYTSFASMKTFITYLSEGLEIKKNTEITSVKRINLGVELSLKNSNKIQVKDSFLILSIPQPQVLNLLNSDFPEISKLIQPAKMFSSVSGLFAFDKALSLKKSHIENSSIYGFHENSRVGQNLNLDCWTIHSKKNYGKTLSQFDKNQIKNHLLNEFERLASIDFPQPRYAEGHRWLYGFTEKALNENYVFNEPDKIGICGDWCRGNTVLDALISGTSLANKILSSMIE